MQFDPGHEYFKAERGSQARNSEAVAAIGAGNEHPGKLANSSSNQPLS